MQATLGIFQHQDGPGPLLQLAVAAGMEQHGGHARHGQLQGPVIGIAQQHLQVAGIAQRHGAIDYLPLAAGLVFDGGQGAEVVLHQLLYCLQRLFQLGFADALGLIGQLAGELPESLLGEIVPGQPLYAVAGGTGIPQPEHRVHGDEQPHQLFVVVDGQALANAIEKVMGALHAAIVLQFGAGAIVHPVELVLVGDPGRTQACQSAGVLAHLGAVLAEGEHQLQGARRAQLGIFGLMEIIATELIGFGIPQQAPEGTQQAGLAPGVLTDENRGVIQPEREPIYPAKTFDFNAFQKHAAISSPS